MKPFEDHLFIKSHRKYWLKNEIITKLKIKGKFISFVKECILHLSFAWCMVVHYSKREYYVVLLQKLM